MYDAIADPYCYGGTSVLKNIPDIRDQAALDEYEAAMTARRADEPLPAGHLSVTQFRAIHHHLFQDVYAWAGRFRTVRLSKGVSAFCYPENIGREMRELFRTFRDKRYLKGLSREAFATEAGIVSFYSQCGPCLFARETGEPRPRSWRSLPTVRAIH